MPNFNLGLKSVHQRCLCINVSWCAIEVDLQREAVGNETHCPHCPCCEGLL